MSSSYYSFEAWSSCRSNPVLYALAVAEFYAGEEQVGMNSQASYSKVPDFETFQEHVKLKFPSCVPCRSAQSEQQADGWPCPSRNACRATSTRAVLPLLARQLHRTRPCPPPLCSLSAIVSALDLRGLARVSGYYPVKGRS